MALDKITTNIIEDDAVTAAKIVAGAVTADIPTGGVATAKLADDAVTPAKIGYLGDGSGNLSGTLTGEQLRFGTAFTLTDDLTVNGDVTLGKVGDDSTGQSLTQNTSANRTLTGTGTLRMGSSMSGRGRLGSGVTFPAGHILQVQEGTKQSQSSTSSNVFSGTGLSVDITPYSLMSKILIIATTAADNEADGRLIELTLYRDSTNLGASNGMVQIYGNGARVGTPVTLSKLDSPNTISTITYEVYWNSANSNVVYLGSSLQVNSIVAMEVAG